LEETILERMRRGKEAKENSLKEEPEPR